MTEAIDSSAARRSAVVESKLNPHQQQLDALLEIGAEAFDPIRFRYIEALVSRLPRLEGEAASVVEDKAGQALRRYRRDYYLARAEAETRVEQIAARDAGLAGTAYRLFRARDFRGLVRLENQSTMRPGSGLTALKALTEELVCGASPAVEEASQGNAIDTLLRQQELELLGSRADQGGGELKSVRQFRELWVKIQSDQRVDRAIDEGPESPGPLNQEKLAISSLSVLRQLSPHYLGRFVSYVDTLLWLERVQDGSGGGGKKRGRARSAR